MAHDSIQLPCDADGACMRCKATPPTEETLTCSMCATPWHVACLASPPETLVSTLQWHCPDCSGDPLLSAAAVVDGSSSELLASIKAIEADESLTEKEKARKRQELVSGRVEEDGDTKKGKGKEKDSSVLDVLDSSLNCSFCMQLPDRPVTTPCGHNFCLKCFQKWIGQGKRTCAKCRSTIPPKMASQPRINSTLVSVIRMAKLSKSNVIAESHKVFHFMHNQDRPDKAFTTERAQKAGKANAASGKIFVTVPPDHFGPITAENDPARNQGVLVGECWEDRLECRQWGAHLPHVAGIAGQSNYGAQSVALSGGYEDDEDHGEWFLYTGSGGRDLSGNKRTNKEQSFDQKFEKMNEALRVSCKKGYPVRVVRSHKEKRSSYAPEKGVRYDGVYRIEKCWRKVGIQGFKVCRYLFVRCDNEPAPWTSDEHGDRPRPLPAILELKKAIDISERKESPSWDFDEEDSCWKWKKPPPPSKKPVNAADLEERKRARKAIRQARNTTVRERLLKEFSCLICRQVMNLPVTTPCAHNFCKSCFEGAFTGKTAVRERNKGGRTLRSQKNILHCPCCPTDVSDFLQNLQVNRELMDVIESLKQKSEENPDPTEDSSEEQTNGLEENADLGSGDSETGKEAEKTDPKDDSEIPLPDCEPKSKRRKVDAARVAASVENDSPSSTLQVHSSDDDFE
ncbi:PREDICTED: E3 ubiquitin-protein ligase ORTHRUS 2 [Theobroma cacao]|uniref:RING-type E3 ubiquitin transferase n=1 Tax=Theobroma cacao TaxID=3641 RepID=A0AB32VAP5_THECC|nr:PREDICTED: E3 ubiquitin-protein ligase ORTHRUS 2 [Theobroma cacao]